ncbi:MAG: hypothetical protein BJG00_012655 [Limnothrix sp. CACIAM 69d]|nr:MAG: hypothetical protein BJG00_012655 [Limnothrix sp. CACIAM 69d]
MHFTSATRSPLRWLADCCAENTILGNFGQRLAHWGHRAVMRLSTPDQIRVWSRTLPTGEEIFYGWDPRTGDRFSSPAERELRSWLEAHHRYRF